MPAARRNPHSNDTGSDMREQYAPEGFRHLPWMHPFSLLSHSPSRGRDHVQIPIPAGMRLQPLREDRHRSVAGRDIQPHHRWLDPEPCDLVAGESQRIHRRADGGDALRRAEPQKTTNLKPLGAVAVLFKGYLSTLYYPYIQYPLGGTPIYGC